MSSPAATERLKCLYNQARHEIANRDLEIQEAEGRYILKLSRVFEEYVKNNGTVPFIIKAKLTPNEDHWGGTYDCLDYSFDCPFPLAYVINQLIGANHPVRLFNKEDFGYLDWEKGKTYQNICEASLVDGDLAFKVLDRKVV